MWQSPGGRTQAASAKKPRNSSRIQMRIQRIQFELRLLGGMGTPTLVMPARALLSDLAEGGIGLFAGTSLAPNQSVEIVLTEPQAITLRGHVVWCQEQVASSHIVSAAPYPFRAGVQFIFASPEEETAVKEMMAELARLNQ